MSQDLSKPNISRVYDYVLGGHHNYEIDRLAAQQIIASFPSYPQWARLNRWFLQLIAERWSSEGRPSILDLGSGMPTVGHFHDHAPNAKILYSDNDGITVSYARQVLGENPNVEYVEVDVRHPSDLLAAADRFFGGDRRVAIGCMGLSYFLDDQALAALMQLLHGWAAPGSVMALTYVYGNKAKYTERSRATMDAFKRAGSPIISRDEAEVCQLCLPWRMQESQPLERWLGVEDQIGEAEREEA